MPDSHTPGSGDSKPLFIPLCSGRILLQFLYRNVTEMKKTTELARGRVKMVPVVTLLLT